jgi:hypothetical protein
MQVEAICQAVVPFGRLVKVLLVWQKSPNFPEETAFLNVLKDRVDYGPGDTVEFILRKKEP